MVPGAHPQPRARQRAGLPQRRLLHLTQRLHGGRLLQQEVRPAITLAESWDGTRWTVLPTPNPGPGPGSAREGDWLQGVSCTSATGCTAVGYVQGNRGPDESIIESWNGTTWSAVPHPRVASADNALVGVACVTTVVCTAVGHTRAASGAAKTLVESWDGTAWAIDPSPSPGGANGSSGLLGASCSAATTCLAAGDDSNGQPGVSKTLTEMGTPAAATQPR